MSGQTSTNQQQQQQSTTQPWAPAQPMLNSILEQLGQAPTGPTSGQTNAIGQIVGEASNTPSYAAPGEATVNNLFGSNTNPQQSTINNAYGSAAGALTPYLNSNWANPATNPYLAPAMSTLNSDITNQIGGEFAAAGRPAGTNADAGQAIARGVAQGEAGLLANQFNTGVGQQQNAATALPQLATSTQGAITGQQQVPLQNAVTGMGAATAIPGLLTQPGTTALNAANLQAGSPTMNLANLESLTNPIAQLGGTSSGSTTGTTSQQSPWYTTALGGLLGGVGLLGGTGAFGQNGWLAPAASSAASGIGSAASGIGGMLGSMGPLALLSDERVKEDIKPVGMLYDETPVFSYRYKGDDTPRIGLIAQDVETRRPDAVVDLGGVKAVDYGKATERSRMIGMLSDLAMAA